MVDSVLLFSDPAPKINHTLTSKPPISVAISSEILASALGRGQYLVWNLNLLSIDMADGGDTWRIACSSEFFACAREFFFLIFYLSKCLWYYLLDTLAF